MRAVFTCIYRAVRYHVDMENPLEMAGFVHQCSSCFLDHQNGEISKGFPWFPTVLVYPGEKHNKDEAGHADLNQVLSFVLHLCVAMNTQ